MPSLIRSVGALAYQNGRLLLIQRGHEPARGRWAPPGGKVEPGETDEAALIREMREETGLVIAAPVLAGTVIREPYEIADYHCTVVGGVLTPGDDAAAAKWVTAVELRTMHTEARLMAGLLETLTAWHALPG